MVRGRLDDTVRDELRERYQATDAVLTDSGTSALVIALRDLVGQRGIVAYPAYSCIDLTAAALKAGVGVRLYDLDPATLSPDLDSVANVLKRGVDAIVVAHLYGYPANLPAIRNLADQRGVLVIEDAAQAAGGELHGLRLGSLGDVSILSFGRGKGMTAGSGGALLVRSQRLTEWTRRAARSVVSDTRGGSEVVALAAQWLLARPTIYGIPASIPGLRLGEMVYREAGEPRSMSTTAAAILKLSLAGDDLEIAHRRAHASEILSQNLEIRRFLPVRSIAGGEPGYLRLALIDRAGNSAPAERLGVLRGYPMTLDQHPQLWPILIAKERAGAGAATLRDRLFTAPTHSRVGAGDVARLRSWLATTGHASPIEAWAT